MTVPPVHETWVNALKLERPWENNEMTRTLVARVKDEDMAAVIWALERTNALKWLDLKLQALGGDSPSSLLSTKQGQLRVWIALEAAKAWF
ncbi:hypothetical protein ACO0LB_19675 [Undibacterium sp. SXout7W]|uniref:hypothetical protein n=1 Tax=Undibacterium sp. SXout7W TaxID=3413049 RepID=UPI003BF09F4D